MLYFGVALKVQFEESFGPLFPVDVACWYGFIPLIRTETVQWLVALEEDVPEIRILPTGTC